MRASDPDIEINDDGTLIHNSTTVKRPSFSTVSAEEASDPMGHRMPVMSELIGKDVALIGLWNDHVNVINVKSIGAGIIRAIIKRTGEEVFISDHYVLFVLRTTPQSRKGFLSRGRGCEFVIRIINAPIPALC